jgi:hypothetical protein
MKLIMKTAVDQIYALLCLKSENPKAYEACIRFGEQYTTPVGRAEPVKARSELLNEPPPPREKKATDLRWPK